MIISHLCELGIDCYVKFVKELETKLLVDLYTITIFFWFGDAPKMTIGALMRHPYRLYAPLFSFTNFSCGNHLFLLPEPPVPCRLLLCGHH